MKRKTILIAVFGVFLVGVIGAGFYARHLIDPQSLGKRLSATLTRTLGRTVTIQGGLHLHVFPLAGLDAEDVIVADAAGSGRSSMIRVDRIRCRVEWLPLFRKRIVVRSVSLERPMIRLVRDRRGQGNWTPFLALASAAPVTTGNGSPPFVLQHVDRIDVENATVQIVDTMTGNRLILRHATFSRIGSRRRGEMKLHGEVKAHVPESGSAFTDFSGTLSLRGAAVRTGPARFKATARDLNVAFSLSPANGPALKGTFSTQADFDSATRRLIFHDMVLVLPGASATGTVNLTDTASAPRVSGMASISVKNSGTLLQGLRLSPGAWAEHLPSTADVRLRFAEAGNQWDVPSFSIATSAGSVNGSFASGSETAPARLRLTLNAPRIDLGSWGRAMGTAGPSTESANARPVVLPAEILGRFGKLDLSLDADIGEAVAGDLTATALTVSARMQNGQVTVSGFKARLLDGEVTGALDAAPIGKALILHGRLGLDGIRADGLPLPERIRGVQVTANGRLSGHGDIYAQGKTPAQWRQSVSGTLALSLAGGDIHIVPPGEPARSMRFADPSIRLSSYLMEPVGTGNPAAPLRSLNLSIAGRNTDTSVAGRITASGSIRFPEDGGWVAADLDTFRARLDLPASKSSPTPAKATVSARLAVDSRNGGTLTAHRVAIVMPGLDADGHLTLRQGPTGLRYTGRLHLAHVFPSRALDALPRQWRAWAPSILDRIPRVSGETEFDADDGGMILDGLKGTIEGTHLSGRIVLGYRLTPDCRFDLTADHLDLNRQIAFLENGGSAEAAETAKASAGTGTRSTWHVAGTVHVGRLIWQDMTLNRFSGQIDAGPDRFALNSFSTGFLGGHATGRLAVDNTGGLRHSRLRLDVKKMPIEQLFGRFTQKRLITGTTEMHVHLQSAGSDPEAMAAALKGRARVVIRNGTIYGIQLRNASNTGGRSADASGASASGSESAPPKEDFDAITGTIDVKGPVLSSTDTQLTAPAFTVNGAGTLNVATDRLNYALTVDLKNLFSVRYHIQGPLDDLTATLDKRELAANTVTGIATAPLRIGEKTLDLATGLLDVGGKAIGNGSGPQTIGQGALKIGKGVLGIGKAVVGTDNRGKNLDTGAKNLGEGVTDLGKGAIEVVEGVGGFFKTLITAPLKIAKPAKDNSVRNSRSGP